MLARAQPQAMADHVDLVVEPNPGLGARPSAPTTLSVMNHGGCADFVALDHPRNPLPLVPRSLRPSDHDSPAQRGRYRPTEDLKSGPRFVLIAQEGSKQTAGDHHQDELEQGPPTETAYRMKLNAQQRFELLNLYGLVQGLSYVVRLLPLAGLTGLSCDVSFET